MNIAVVDVAAESSGALSVLTEFYEYVKSHPAKGVRWYFFLSVVELEGAPHIKIINTPYIKKSWAHRLLWEYITFPQYVKHYNIDTVLSLQNKALPIRGIKQVVYFHNALHTLPADKFDIRDNTQRSYAMYCRLITPITLQSFRYCDTIITQTHAVKEGLRRKGVKNRIEVVYPNVNVTADSGNNAVRGFIYPCGANAYKNHQMIIDAVKKAGRAFAGEILFTLTGDENAYAMRVREACKRVDRIKFVGYLSREELLDTYRDYGLIFASDVESYPIPFAEAMAYGTPIIARDMDYAREILAGYPNSCYYENVAELTKLLSRKQDYKRAEGIETGRDDSWRQVIELINI